MTTYRIQCRAAGGVTGVRTSFLTENGVPYITTNIDEAKKRAELLNKEMNGPNATAYYTYWVV